MNSSVPDSPLLCLIAGSYVVSGFFGFVYSVGNFYLLVVLMWSFFEWNPSGG